MMTLRITDSVKRLALSARSQNCFEYAKIKTIGDLVTHSERELTSMRSFGESCLEEVKRSLARHGLVLGLPPGVFNIAPTKLSTEDCLETINAFLRSIEIQQQRAGICSQSETALVEKLQLCALKASEIVLFRLAEGLPDRCLKALAQESDGGEK